MLPRLIPAPTTITALVSAVVITGPLLIVLMQKDFVIQQ
jgi:hypothetical protein